MLGTDRWHVHPEPTGSHPVTTPRLLTAFGILDIAVGIGVWAATGNALVGIVIIVAGILLLVVPAMRVQQPDPSEGLPPDQTEDPPANQSKSQRPSKSEGALDRARAEQQRLEDETAAGIENVEDRPPPTGA